MEPSKRVKRTYWIPADLEQWLRERARRRYRTTTGELVEILRRMRDQEQGKEGKQ